MADEIVPIITASVAIIGGIAGLGSLGVAIYNARKNAPLTTSNTQSNLAKIVDTQEDTIKKLLTRVDAAETKLETLARGRYRVTTLLMVGEFPIIESQMIEAVE